jgi:Fic family protein
VTLKPKFKITDKILENISQITAGREIIENSRLIPKWELKLQKEARVHNAHSSTSIEGNRLSLEQVQALSEKKQVTASAKDKQEVVNYLQALNLIPEFAKNKINTKLFLKIHKIITAGTLKNKNDSGAFRDRQVFVGRRVFDGTQIKNVVEYMPPDTKDVPRLVKEFLDWLESKSTLKINPVLLAGIAHYEIARIHPFIDGNGRTARLLATLILYKRGFDHHRFFALDDYYDEERSAYYTALKTVDKNKGDLTGWLEYFTEGVLNSVNKVKEIVNKLGLSPKFSPKEIIELTQRQIKILEALRVKEKISNRDLRNLFKISRQAMLKEITKLIKAGIVILIGKGRNAYYKISE